MSETGYVYTLNDPRTDEPRYVGASIHPERRFNQHLANPNNIELSDWILKLKDEGEQPEMEIVAEVDIDKLGRVEMEMADELYQEYDLLNKLTDNTYTRPKRYGGPR